MSTNFPAPETFKDILNRTPHDDLLLHQQIKSKFRNVLDVIKNNTTIPTQYRMVTLNYILGRLQDSDHPLALEMKTMIQNTITTISST